MELDKYFSNSTEDLLAVKQIIDAEEDPRVKVTMRILMARILSKNISERELLSSVSKVLEYTKAKPVTKTEIKVEEEISDEWKAALSEIETKKDA